jgi:hypothetical protein
VGGQPDGKSVQRNQKPSVKGTDVTDPTNKVPPGLTDSLDKVQVLIDRIERRQDDQSKIISLRQGTNEPLRPTGLHRPTETTRE